ncbi:MAG: DMT family transporter [Pseudorhodoplanes sp.]
MQVSPQTLAVRAAPMLFVFLWSTGFITAKYGLPYAEPLTFLSLRMALVVIVLAGVVAVVRPRWPSRVEMAHSAVIGALVHGLYLGGVFVAISQGVPAGISALIPGLQPVVTSTLASRWLGERVTPLQWFGLALGVVGVLIVLHDRALTGEATPLGWIAAFLSLIGISLGSLYQKRHSAAIDWRAGNLFQYLSAFALFFAGALVFETLQVRWTTPFVLALSWSVVVMSIFAIALMYWLIRRMPAAKVASLFYLVPAVTALMAWILFDEKLDALSLFGMAICAGAVLVVSAPRS